MSPENLKSLETEPGLRVVSLPDTNCNFVSMNLKKPPFDNVKVRQAVNYTIPIQAIIPNVLYGYGEQMKSPFQARRQATTAHSRLTNMISKRPSC